MKNKEEKKTPNTTEKSERYTFKKTALHKWVKVKREK